MCHAWAASDSKQMAWCVVFLDSTMQRLGSVVLLIGLTLTAHARGQAPSRTGLIVGQVVDATTGRPVPDVIVTLTTPFASSNLPSTPRGRVLTDAEGRFFFADLPATPVAMPQQRSGSSTSGYAIRHGLSRIRPSHSVA